MVAHRKPARPPRKLTLADLIMRRAEIELRRQHVRTCKILSAAFRVDPMAVQAIVEQRLAKKGL
jgi:hypothetical protein